jgi:Flp pilus assembly protein CpaB
MTGRWSALLQPGRRTLVGLALAAAAGGLVMLLTKPQPTEPVLVADGPLPAGVPLDSMPLGVRRMNDATGLVVGDDAENLAGWTLASPVAEGEPLLTSLLRAPERTTYPSVLAVSVEAAHAVLGDIQAGDSLDVYVTVDNGASSVATSLVARSIFVVSAALGSDSLGGEEMLNLLVAVDEVLAPKLAAAMAAGELDLVRVSR